MLITDEVEKEGWFFNLCTKILKNGPIPKHIGIIMDGNRRFARNLDLESSHGHMRGMNSLFQTLFWCRKLDITEVTVYAFSLDNFKRSKQEVDCLMELAYEKFSQLLVNKEKLDEYGIQMRFIGRLELLPVHLQSVLANVILATKHHDKCYLNVCISYTSRDEITTAVGAIARGCTLGHLMASDVDARLLSSSLQLPNEPDLLIRTSGEVRLSDFMLCQSSYSVLAFLDVLWPAFTYHHLNLAIVYYQQNYNCIQKARKQRNEHYDKIEESELSHLYGKENLEKSKKEKNIRTDTFLKTLKESRYESVNNLLNKT